MSKLKKDAPIGVNPSPAKPRPFIGFYVYRTKKGPVYTVSHVINGEVFKERYYGLDEFLRAHKLKKS